MAATIGYVNIIKRSGKDGSRFPVTEDCRIGSGLQCEIRIHLDDVAVEHCVIQCQEGGKCLLRNLSTHMPTKLNNNNVTEVAMLRHGDIIGVSDRLFRWEYEAMPQVSTIIKPSLQLLPQNVTGSMGSPKRLVAVVSPQIRETPETSQSLRTWVLRKSVGSSLSARSRQPKRTPEQRRRTSVVSIITQDQPAVQDNMTPPQSVNISRRASIKSSVKKSLQKGTHLRKSDGVSTVKSVAKETPQIAKSDFRDGVYQFVGTPVSQTPRLRNSSESYSVTPRSRKSMQVEKLSHSVVSRKSMQVEKLSQSLVSLKEIPDAEETIVASSSQTRSLRKDPLGVHSTITSANSTPVVRKKFLTEQTPNLSEVQTFYGKKSQRYSQTVPAADTSMAVLQSPDLFSSDQVSITEEMETLERLKKSTPALTGRPKRKSAGLLLAHIRESQQSFSRGRRNSTPSGNTEKRNTRSAGASVVVPKRSRLSFTPARQSKTPRKLKSLREMSAKAAKRKLTDIDLSEIAANKLKAESPKTPDKKKMAALLQCHKPRMLFSEVVKKTPVKRNVVAKAPSLPVGRRKKLPKKPKVHTPRKAPVKGINSTGHVDSPETIIIHGKHPLKRSVQGIKEECESQRSTATSATFEQAKDIKNSVAVKELPHGMNTRKSVSFSPAPQVVAFAASRRISTRKSLKFPNISEEVHGTPLLSSELSTLETQHNRKASILKKPSTPVVPRAEPIEINRNSSAITNLESVHDVTSVVSSTPVRVSERQKGRTSSQLPSSPKKTVATRKSSSFASVTHQSPEALNTSIVSQASTTFDFDAVTTPCISVEKLVSPLSTTSSKKQTNSDQTRRTVNISAQQIFKALVADKVIDSSKQLYNDVNAATSATDASQLTSSESLVILSGKKSDRKSVSLPLNHHSARKSQRKRSLGEVCESSKKTVPELDQQEVTPPALKKRSVSVDILDRSSISKEACGFVTNELEQLPCASKEPPKARHVKQLTKSPKQQKSPRNDLTDISGVKQLLKTPRTQKSPQNDLTDVRGVKGLLGSPLKRTSPKNDLTDVRGVKKLLRSPLKRTSPKNDLTNVMGVRRLLGSPLQQQKSPQNDLTDVRGVKRLLQSPRLQKSPPNDLTDVRGVRQLLEPPQLQKSPLNDLTDVRGVKQILRSPRLHKSPSNDLTDVRGVKELFRSTRKRASPENDLTDVRGVKQLLRSPQQHKSPYNDLRDVRGVKKLFRSSEKYKSPKNDLSDVAGVSSLFHSPRQEILSINKKSGDQKQELSPSLTETQANVSITKPNNKRTAEQEASVPLSPKRKKYNLHEEEIIKSSNSEKVGSVKNYSTRGRRTKKDFSSHPDTSDIHSIEKSEAIKDRLPQEKIIPPVSDDVKPESQKNINPPRTRKGKVKVSAEDPLASDEKEVRSDGDLLVSSNTGHTSAYITNSPPTRRTRKKATEKLIDNAIVVSSGSTSSPRSLRGKKIATTDSKPEEELKSESVVEINTVPLPKTRRGRKQTVSNKKVDMESQQPNDALEKPKQDGLKATEKFIGNASNTSPPRTLRGKTITTTDSKTDEELKSESVVEIKTVPSPKTRRGRKQTVSNKKVDMESQQSNDAMEKPKQDGLKATEKIIDNAGNTSSPRTLRGKTITTTDSKADGELISESVVEINTVPLLKTRRGRKQTVTNKKVDLESQQSNVALEKPKQDGLKATEEFIDNAGNTSPPRTFKGKMISTTDSKTDEELKSVSVVEINTVPSPKTRRGRKHTAGNQKVDTESRQLSDALEKPKHDELIKSSLCGSSGTVSPRKTRRGTQITSLDTVPSPRTRRGRKQIVDDQKIDGESQKLHDADESIKSSQSGSPVKVSPLKTRRGIKTLVTDLNLLESKKSDNLSLKPRQKRVVFAAVIEESSPSNRSSPRRGRGKNQAVSNEETDKNSSLKNDQILLEEPNIPRRKNVLRKIVNTDSTECSPSNVTDQTRTRRGRKNQAAGESEEVKLPLKTPSSETSTAGESKQNKVSNNAGGVDTNTNNVSPLKPRRGRRVETVTSSAVSTEKNSSKDSAVTDSSPPKRQRLRTHGDTRKGEERKRRKVI